MSVTGQNWLVYVDSTPSPASAYTDVVWQLIGGQKGLDRSGTLDTADATTKDSDNNEEVLPTNKKRELSLDNLYQLDDVGTDIVERMLERREFRFVKIDNGSVQWIYLCLCTEFSFSAPEDDAVGNTVTFKPSGTPTRIPALA